MEARGTEKRTNLAHVCNSEEYSDNHLETLLRLKYFYSKLINLQVPF